MNRGIELTSATYTVTRIHKKTRAKLFADIVVGDVLRFKMYMDRVGRASGGGCYATNVTVENVTKGTSDGSKSQSAVTCILVNFEITEVEA